MNWKKHLTEAATLIAAAVLCALVSNAVASHDRKIVMVGNYPNALKVPGEVVNAPLAPIASAPVTMTAPTVTATSAPTITAPAATTTMKVAKTTTGGSQAAVPAGGTPALQPTTHIPQPKPADISKFQPHPDKQYIEIGYDDVAALHSAGVLFLDARRTNIYQDGHIAGARPFSVWESDVDEKVNKLWEQRQDPKDQALPIVVYCSGGDCEDSHMLAGKLYGILFNNVYVYKDGFPDWQKHGGAVHTGANP